MTINDKYVPVLCLVVGLLLGFSVGGWQANKASTELANIKERAMNPGMVATGSVYQMTGVLRAIKGNTLTLVVSYPKDPFNPTLDEREVLVDDKTVITIESSKDKTTLEKEQAAQQEKMAEWAKTATLKGGIQTVSPPPMVTITDFKDGTFTSFEIGQTVRVYAGENVKTKKNFVATKVNIIKLIRAF